jgi:flagellar motor switch protein FliN/FliY
MKTDYPPNLDLLLDVPVGLTVVLNLNIGSIVQLDKVADAPVELRVNDKLIARGEVVVVENRFGIKITELVGATQ